MRKRMTGTILLVALSFSVLTGCGNTSGTTTTTDSAATGSVITDTNAEKSVSEDIDNKKINIVTTTFPVYDWVKNITKGTDIKVTILEDTGVDLHNYQPTAEDVVAIKSSDLFVYVGGESDDWAESFISDNTIHSLNLMNVIGDNARTEELLEGMEEEKDHEDGDMGYDEHIWLSRELSPTYAYAKRSGLLLMRSAH